MTGRAPRRSLRTRLLAAALVLVLAALVVAGLVIGVILHRFVRGQLDGRLDAQIVALRAGLEAGILPQGLDAPPFDRPGPGWAWEVRRGGATIRSGSLRGGDIRLSIPNRTGSRAGRTRLRARDRAASPSSPACWTCPGPSRRRSWWRHRRGSCAGRCARR